MNLTTTPKNILKGIILGSLFFFTTLSSTLAQEVGGTVVDESGVPMIGVSILVKGTTQGTLTDDEGKFSLNVPGISDTLRISYLGYETQDVPIAGQSQIEIAMEESVTSLDEVVVVGYGTVKKKDLTGAVAQIDAAKIANSVS